MEYTVMQDVAFLFVEQYEKLVEAGMLHEYKRSDVDLIRATAEKGEAAMYMVVATIFGPSLDQALAGAAYWGMDYLAYDDEEWDSMDAKEKRQSAELAELHLESVRTIKRLSQRNDCTTVKEIEAQYEKAEHHIHRIRERM